MVSAHFTPRCPCCIGVLHIKLNAFMFSYNEVGDRGAECLGPALARLSSLEMLFLRKQHYVTIHSARLASSSSVASAFSCLKFVLPYLFFQTIVSTYMLPLLYQFP
jgi:hypothetical protein